MHRLHDIQLTIVQIGIRSLTREEHRLIETSESITTLFAHDVADLPAASWWPRVDSALGDRQQVYVTIDLDGLDPSIMPSTGTPEPGGADLAPGHRAAGAARQPEDDCRRRSDGARHRCPGWSHPTSSPPSWPTG